MRGISGIGLAIGGIALLAGNWALAGTVYERTNLMEYNFVGFGPGGTAGRPSPGDRIGQQVTLAGADRYLTRATVFFGYGSAVGTVNTYPDTYTAELYRNDGTGGAPGTKIATSTVAADSIGPPISVDFPFSTSVPDTFTIAVSSTHPLGTWSSSTGITGVQSAYATPSVGSSPNTFWFNTNTAATTWVSNSTWAINDGAPTNYMGLRLEAFPSAPVGRQTIVRDSFDRVNRSLANTAPTQTIVPGAQFVAQGSSGIAWQSVAIGDCRVVLDTDVGLSIPIASSGSYVKPKLLEISARLNLGTLTDPGDIYAQGMGLGFFNGTDPAHGFTYGRGLVLGRNGSLTLVNGDGLDSASVIAYQASLFGNQAFSPSGWHSLMYQIDTRNGDISSITLDGVLVGDLTTNIFTDANTPRAGFWSQTYDQFKNGYVDNFEVVGVPEPGSLMLLAVGAIALLARRRRA